MSESGLEAWRSAAACLGIFDDSSQVELARHGVVESAFHAIFAGGDEAIPRPVEGSDDGRVRAQRLARRQSHVRVEGIVLGTCADCGLVQIRLAQLRQPLDELAPAGILALASPHALQHGNGPLLVGVLRAGGAHDDGGNDEPNNTAASSARARARDDATVHSREFRQALLPHPERPPGWPPSVFRCPHGTPLRGSPPAFKSPRCVLRPDASAHCPWPCRCAPSMAQSSGSRRR